MTEQEHDKAIREELRRAKTPPRRPGMLRRLLPLLLAAAVVLGLAAFAAGRGLNSMDGVRRLFTYNKVRQDEDGKAELFRYDSDRSATYAALGDGLLIVSTTRIQFLGSTGEELWSKTVNFTNPAVTVGKKTAAVYDVGGTELYIVGARGLVRTMDDAGGNGILSATLNAADYLALTTLKSGYRAAVSAYDASGAPVFTFNSSERYVSDACVLADNRHLAAVTMGEAEGMFASTLSFYAFDSDKAISTSTLNGSMVYALRPFGGKVAALEDGRFTVFNADGSLAGSYRYEYPYLRGETVGGADFGVLLLSRYRSGSVLRLVTVDTDGEKLGSLDARREVVGISAAGRYVAVLYSDSLTIYTADFTGVAPLASTEFARQVVMRSDGTALLLGASRAWLYIPG